MQNLTTFQAFLAKVAATADDPDPHRCALARAYGCHWQTAFNGPAKDELGQDTAAQVMAGWDDTTDTGSASIMKGSKANRDMSLTPGYALGVAAARACGFGGGGKS